AILSAPQQPLSVVVCTDGVAHLIDPTDFRYLERQQVQFPAGNAMPLFAAQIDPQGRLLYIGVADNEARHCGSAQRVVVHDLVAGQRLHEWPLKEPFFHMALTPDGAYLCGASFLSNNLWVLDACTGQPEAVMRLDGWPVYVMPAP